MGRFKEAFLTYLKGVGMGGADVVPGVSGGTIAFITGIYEKLLNSIKEVDLDAIKLLFSFKFKEFWQKINGSFLLPLFLGIATSLLTLAKIIKYLLADHPIPLWSFFFGLIIISAILVLKAIKKWSVGVIIAIIIGIGIAYYITIATPAETPDAAWFIFISGAVAICAMILPGISGAFILLILGKYEFIVNALSSFDIVTLLIFGAGCLVGLLSFARAVSWLLNHYYNIAIGLLSGFMIGSLNKVWPWKVTTRFRIDSHGESLPYLTKNVLPGEYQEQVGDPQLLIGILFIALGILLVVSIEQIAKYKAKPRK